MRAGQVRICSVELVHEVLAHGDSIGSLSHPGGGVADNGVVERDEDDIVVAEASSHEVSEPSEDPKGGEESSHLFNELYSSVRSFVLLPF